MKEEEEIVGVTPCWVVVVGGVGGGCGRRRRQHENPSLSKTIQKSIRNINNDDDAIVIDIVRDAPITGILCCLLVPKFMCVCESPLHTPEMCVRVLEERRYELMRGRKDPISDTRCRRGAMNDGWVSFSSSMVRDSQQQQKHKNTVFDINSLPRGYNDEWR